MTAAIPESARPRTIRRGAGGPRLHFLGVCGKGMGAIAAAMHAAGWRVTGSDQDTYPPMDLLLGAAGLRVRTPYAAANVPADADLVVVGKRLRADNPELAAVLERGLPYCSFPALLRDAFLDRSRNAVVAGGLGKTTTTAMLAWILEATGRRPDFVIGGVPRDLGSPARLAGAALAVIEGDEYASCFDDPAPKFLKYRPEVVVITNIVEDHPDLYADAAAVAAAFRSLAATLPPDGCLIVPDDDDLAAAVARHSPSPVVRIGSSARATLPLRITGLAPARTDFEVDGVGFSLPLAGRMNAVNAAMAAAAARHLGVPPADAARALARFSGVARRQEIRVLGGVALVADKATHPRAVAALLDAVRQAFPGRRLVSLVRPRATGGSGWVYQRELPMALARADRVLLLPAYEHDPAPGAPRPTADAFDIGRLGDDIAAAGTAVAALDPADLGARLAAEIRVGDVVVTTLPEQDLATAGVVERALAAIG